MNIKKVCRFTVAYLNDERLGELIDDGYELVVNPNSSKDESNIILIDLANRKYTFIKENNTRLMNIPRLNEYYVDETLDVVVTIPD